MILCMVHFYLLPSPPGEPRGQVQPFGPGGGELFEAVLSRGEGGGAIRSNFLLFFCRYVTSRPSRLTPDRMEETAYFQGESLEFVADWLQKNNLSKLKLFSKVVLLWIVKRM